MRSIVEIQLHSVDQMTYGEFLMSLPNPTSFNVFSMKPLEGSGVIEINPSIAFPMLDRLLGGKGEPFDASREFSDIELSLFETILRVMMSTLKEAWGPVMEIYPAVESKESSPNVVQIVAQNEIVVMVVMEIIIGHSSGMMNICYPVISLEPILPKLASRDLMLNETSSKKSRNTELKVLLGGAKVNVEANLGDADLSMAEILDLKVGDVLRLSTAADDIVTVSVDGKERFKGEIGLRRFRKSIQITEIIETEKDAVKRALEKLEKQRHEKISGVKDIIHEDDDLFKDEEE
jgi:flagellar motor switch protein FliM